MNRNVPWLRSIHIKVAQRLFYPQRNLRDIYDSYVARPLPSRRTPFGFLFGGLASQHHLAMQHGTFEPGEVALLSALLRRVDAFVDVGANVGYYTCIARQVGRPAIAIEPMPMNLRALYENLRANSWDDTEVLALGASDHVGIETLFGASSTGASLISNWARAPSLFKRTIPVSTLDTVLAGRFIDRRLLVKVDVEGHEYFTLRGASSLLQRATKPIWLIEITFHQHHPDGSNPNFGATFEMLWKEGYAAFLLDDKTLQRIESVDIERWQAQRQTETGAINYLFVPPDALSLLGDLLPPNPIPGISTGRSPSPVWSKDL
jgi:FkbM family methyltransferase